MKVVKNIPIPENASKHNGSKCKYPWAKMVIGESFYTEECQTRHGLQSTSFSWCLRNNPEAAFTVRPEGVGFRAWRIK